MRGYREGHPVSRASRLIGLYQSIHRNVKQIEKLTACHVVKKKTGMEWSEQEKKDLSEVYDLFYQAQSAFDKVMSAKIGDAVTTQVRTGEWGKKR